MCRLFKLQNRIPVTASWGHFLGKTFRSLSGTTTPSMVPNWLEIPKQRSMMKKRTDQAGEPGILVMASVNTMKARPVPSTPWTHTLVTTLNLTWYYIPILLFLLNNSHLTEKSLHVACFDVQSKNNITRGAVEILKGFLVVAWSDALSRKVKCI